jgi:hypothetical protein
MKYVKNNEQTQVMLLRDQKNEDEIGGHVADKEAVILHTNQMERDYFGARGVSGSIILKCSSKI